MSKLFNVAFARAALEKFETLPQRPTHVPLILNLARSSAATNAVPRTIEPRIVIRRLKRKLAPLACFVLPVMPGAHIQVAPGIGDRSACHAACS